MVNDLDFEGIEFPVSKGIISKLNRKIKFRLMYFVMEIILFILIIYQIKSLKIRSIYCWCQTKIGHTMCILKIYFNGFMYNKTKCRTKEYYSRYCLQCFSSELVLIEHKETCFKINDKQSIKLKVVQLILKIISNN